MDTAHQLAKTVPFKFQDWAISLIDGLASNPQKVGDDGIDIFGVFLNKPDNMDRKAIIVQVTGASGSQKAKFDRLHANIRNENAAMGILITLDVQTAQRNGKHTLDPIRMGETTYAPIQCFSIEEYYRNNERWDQVLSFLRWQIRGQGSICSRRFYLMSKGEKTYETQPREITSSQTS